MINYTEKGAALHLAISAAGYSLEQRDGVWVSSDDTAVQAIIAAYDPLPPTKAEKIAAVREEAQARIVASYPLWRQSNAALGLVPEAEVLVMQNFIADHIDASNAAEDAIDAATTVAQVEGVTPLWP
jgi:hypothetical protein